MTQFTLSFTTPGRTILNITAEVAELVSKAGIHTGLCNIFLQHTSASLSICENFDPLVLRDLEVFMETLIPDNNPLFQHVAEGPDDMPSHVRTVLTQSSLTIPITNNQLALGQWQGIYLWEHRLRSHQRRIVVTFIGV